MTKIWNKQTLKEFATLVATLAITLAVVMAPDMAWAQEGGGLGALEGKVGELVRLIVKIIQILMGLAGAILGYIWAKGDAHARERTEKWLIGCVITFGATSIMSFFGAK